MSYTRKSRTGCSALSHKLLPIFLLVSGGVVYFLLEICFRGWSHWSMAICGGVCFLLIYHMNHALEHRSVALRAGLGATIITAIEFIAGCILNLWLGLDIWDYSIRPINILGQICLSMSVLWFVLSFCACFLCSFLQHKVFEYKSTH